VSNLLRMLAVSGLLLCGANAYAQSAGAAVSLEYGTIEALKPVQAKSSRGAGTLIGASPALPLQTITRAWALSPAGYSVVAYKSAQPATS
jgi:hypothetical protein